MFVFIILGVASEHLGFIVSNHLISVNVLGILLFVDEFAFETALAKLCAALVEVCVVPSKKFTLACTLSDDEASSEGLTVAVLASNQAGVLLASAFSSSRELNGQGEGLVLGIGLSLGSRNILDGVNGHEVLARCVRRYFAFVGPSAIGVDLEKRHRDGAVCTDSRHALGDGFLELCGFVDRGLLLAVEFLGTTGRVIALGIARGLVEEPEVLASNIGDAEADAFHAIGTFDLGDDTVSADRGSKEEGGEEASVEEHVVIEREDYTIEKLRGSRRQEQREPAQEDEKVKKRVEAKNHLENYAYSLKNSIADPTIAGKMSDLDKQTVDNAVKNTVEWLDRNQTAEIEELEHKQKELESIVHPIMTKMYQNGESHQETPQQQNSRAQPQSGPRVEEVD